MKKIVIYLLAMMMAFSPAAVFADVEAQADPGDAVEAGSEVTEDAAVPEQAAEEVADEDADLAPAEEEAVQEELVEAEPEVLQSNETMAGEDDSWTTGWNSAKTQYKKEGVIQTGLFKGVKKNGSEEYALFHADSQGFIEKREGPVVVDGLEKGKYFSFNGRAFDFDANLTGPVTYFQKYDSAFECYCMDEVAGIKTYNGKKYYLKTNGIVETNEGLLPLPEGTFYVQAGGAFYTTPGWLDANNGNRYFLDNAEGRLRTAAGLFEYAGSKYVTLDGGAVYRTPGFVNAGGARYYIGDSSGALVVNREFTIGSKKYHALADGTIGVGIHKWGKYYYFGDANGVIRTKKGVVSFAGNKFYVKSGGKLITNKKVKYKGKTYIASSNGAFFKGIFTWKKNLYYASSKCVLRTKSGVFSYNGNRYASKKGGKLYRNKLFTLKGKKYLAQSDGKLMAGSFSWKGKLYLTNSKCAIITKAGLYTYGSHQYYVKKGGPLAVNQFVTYKGNHYYAGGDGAIVKKKFTYKGITITPNSQTGVISLEEYWKVFPNEAPQPTEN